MTLSIEFEPLLCDDDTAKGSRGVSLSEGVRHVALSTSIWEKDRGEMRFADRDAG